MARWQIVVKTSEATKPTKTKMTTTTTKTSKHKLAHRQQKIPTDEKYSEIIETDDLVSKTVSQLVVCWLLGCLVAWLLS